jgi:hypothetical protein
VKRPLFVLFLLLEFTCLAYGQGRWKKFRKLTCPEKKWVAFHPFVAKKAFEISERAVTVTREMKDAKRITGSGNGDQVDAFRHAFWMGLLTGRIGARKARKLGVAHEKGNHIQFTKNTNEEGEVPDSVSCRMDLINNEAGILIGKQIKKDKEEKQEEKLKEIVLLHIGQGKMKIIAKDQAGNFLDCNGKVILAEELKGKWKNNKCLINSNQTLP